MCLTLAVLCPTLVEVLRKNGKSRTKIRPIVQRRQFIDLGENVQQIAQIHENGRGGHHLHCWTLKEDKIGDGNIICMHSFRSYMTSHQFEMTESLQCNT